MTKYTAFAATTDQMDALAKHEPEPAVSNQHPGNPYRLPDKPLITIEPGRAWSTRSLADLWANRELLYFLIWRDVKVRYKQTALGAAWAILQPGRVHFPSSDWGM